MLILKLYLMRVILQGIGFCTSIYCSNVDSVIFSTSEVFYKDLRMTSANNTVISLFSFKNKRIEISNIEMAGTYWNWITGYNLMYSDDGLIWHGYKESGTNSWQVDSIVYHSFIAT